MLILARYFDFSVLINKLFAVLTVDLILIIFLSFISELYSSLCLLHVLKVWLFLKAAPTFQFVHKLVTRYSHSAGAHPQDSDKEKEERRKKQDQAAQARGVTITVCILSAATFAIVVYLSYKLGVQFLADDDEEDETVRRFGDFKLDYYFGDRYSVEWSFDKERGQYVYEVEEIWTDDELSSDDEPVAGSSNSAT